MTTARLTRDLDEAMLGGVLAGVAARYGWDVTLLRIVAVLVTLATAVLPAVILYLVAWLIMPRPGELPIAAAGEATPADEPTDAGPGDESEAEPDGAATVVDEVADALRDAADRIGEAATIAADAARQAANEIGDVARRPRSVAVEEPPVDGAGGESVAAEDADSESEGDSSA